MSPREAVVEGLYELVDWSARKLTQILFITAWAFEEVWPQDRHVPVPHQREYKSEGV